MQQATTSTSAADGGSWFALVTLTLLVVLVAVLAWYFRRRLNLHGGDASIQLLGARAIGVREQVVVVRVHGRLLVLGHTPSSISLLCELEPGEVTDTTPLPQGADFARLIRRFSGKERA